MHLQYYLVSAHRYTRWVGSKAGSAQIQVEETPRNNFLMQVPAAHITDVVERGILLLLNDVNNHARSLQGCCIILHASRPGRGIEKGFATGKSLA